MHVEVVYALPEIQHRAHLELREGACVADALNAVQRLAPFSALALDAVSVGVYGQLAPRTQVLHHGDRVELYRPLKMDPKEARRRRAAQHGA
jgi:putative ubiquitin-RnfH superfamily antitoxin RatB of RatAB toxin-antitoxin module